ncbi:hypothetical protein [Phytohabitans suffuscus]|nr:hypothetical protein [Phytohabitans suffuscus]
MNRAERIEGIVLVLLLIIIGGLAGAASFTHGGRPVKRSLEAARSPG